MTCDRIKTDLDDYLDEEMAADARWELEAHVQYCEPCQAVLERARRLQRALGTYPVDGPMLDAERLRSRGRRRRRSRSLT